jgi:hypothetical protein
MAFAETLRSGEGAQFPTMQEMKARAFDLLQGRAFGDVVTYAEFEAALSVNPNTDRRARTAVLRAARRLLVEQHKKSVNVRNVGYRIVKPNEHVGVSQAEQRRARRWLREALKTATYVALDDLSPTEVARVMTEQARAAVQVAMTKRLANVKELPARSELALPSGTRLVEMMRKAK